MPITTDQYVAELFAETDAIEEAFIANGGKAAPIKEYPEFPNGEFPPHLIY